MVQMGVPVRTSAVLIRLINTPGKISAPAAHPFSNFLQSVLPSLVNYSSQGTPGGVCYYFHFIDRETEVKWLAQSQRECECRRKRDMASRKQHKFKSTWDFFNPVAGPGVLAHSGFHAQQGLLVLTLDFQIQPI